MSHLTLCAGTNDSKADLYEIVRNTLAARQYAEAGGGILMVAGIIGERRGSPSDTSQAAIVALNQMLKAAHGRYFVDFLIPPTTAEMTAVGYAPTSADLADIAAGYWPGGLYASGDDTHFIGAGQNIYANRAAALFTTLKASH